MYNHKVPRITLHTYIQASPEVCFNLSRSVDLHKISTQKTGEEAIAGVTSGLMDLGDSVTWRAKHLGLWHTLSSKITAMEAPHFFVDEQQQGIFNRFRHEHRFLTEEQGTHMVDVFDYTAPWGFLGRCADVIFLKKYMSTFLEERNRVIKSFAESGEWKQVI